MKKVLIVTSSGDRAKYISKGFIDAFRKFLYFVFSKHVEDLNINEAEKIAADIVFIIWSARAENDKIEYFLDNYKAKSVFIHYSEISAIIPEKYSIKKNHYVFAADAAEKEKRIAAVPSESFKNSAEGYRYKISFAGNPALHNRELVLTELVKNFGRLNIFCRSFDFYKSLDDIIEQKLLDERELEIYKLSFKGYLNKTTELGAVYASSKVNIDIQGAVKKDINYRVLEITAAKGFVIAPYSEPLIKQYEEGKDLETYKNTEELTDKIRFYLKHTEISGAIAERGRQNTAGNFAPAGKLKRMLRLVYGKNFNC